MGVRSNTRAFPTVTKYLASLVGDVLPEFKFSTVTVFRNVKTPVHLDAHNEQQSLNALLAISHFHGEAYGWQAKEVKYFVR